MHPPCDCPQHPVEKSQTFAVKMLTNTFYTEGGRGGEAVEILKNISCQVIMHRHLVWACYHIFCQNTPGWNEQLVLNIYVTRDVSLSTCLRCCFKSRSDSDTILNYLSALYLWWNWWVWCPLLPLHSLQTQCWFHSGSVQTPSPAASPRCHEI